MVWTIWLINEWWGDEPPPPNGYDLPLGTSSRFGLFCRMSLNWPTVLLEIWFFSTLPACILIVVMALPSNAPPPATEVKCAMSLIHAHRKPVWWKGRASWKPQWEAWMILIVFNSVHKCMARKTCPRDISNPKCLLVPFQLIHCTLPSDSIPSWVLDGWVIPTNAVFSVTKMPQKPMRISL